MMFTVCVILALCFLLFGGSLGDTGSQASSNAGNFDIQINVQSELQFIREQLINLDRDVTSINRKLRHITNECGQTKMKNFKLKDNTDERLDDFSKVLNATRIAMDGLNASTLSMMSKYQMNLLEISKDLNKTRDESLQTKNEVFQNFTTVGSQLQDMKISVNEQTMHQITTEEKFKHVDKVLNSTRIAIEGMNFSTTSMINNNKIRLSDISRDLNKTSDESLQTTRFKIEVMNNFTTFGSQFQDLEVWKSDQTMRQNTLERNVNLTSDKIEGCSNMVSLMKVTVDRLNSVIKERLPAQDCQELLSANQTLRDGVYTISPANIKSRASVFCDMKNGGWIVFQRRQDGSEDFFRGWDQYRDGFGDPENEYWLGNKYLHLLTSGRNCTLRIDLVNRNNIRRYAEYTDFRIGDEAGGFTLHIGSYTGNAGYDSLRIHNGMKFTTKDNDQDTYSGNCAVIWTGAWWYRGCHESNLNGDYSVRDNYKGVRWYGYPSSDFMKYTAMKLKCS